MSDQILERIQADICALLKATPTLSLANVIRNDAETTDSKIENAIKTLTPTGGKRGLALVVLRPEVTKTEGGLPGPPLTLKVEIQCVEQPLLNRGADGTMIRSSQAALRVLSCLHFSNLGATILYAQDDAIKAVQVKTGYLSDAVTIFARFNGFVTERPAGVAAAMLAPGTEVVVSGVSSAWPANAVYPVAGTANGRNFYQFGIYRVKWTGTAWIIEPDSGMIVYFTSSQNVATPDQVTAWTPVIGTGALLVSPASAALELTCASPASSIRYTTDGSYPSPSNPLYTTPVTGLATGTSVRAAAYVAGMPPGDVLELTITA